MNEQNEKPSGAKSPEKSDMAVVKEIYSWLESFAITVALILVVFTFFLRTAYVKGGSMENTLIDGETLAVSNFFYTPKQGDIVVFQSPTYGLERGGLVKRVIATEGQVVDIDFDTWAVTVDGEPIEEPYVNRVPGSMDWFDVRFPVTVPEGCIFVMGDNRNNSTDSRSGMMGFVDTRHIFGRVLFRITPFDKFGAVK